MLWIFTSEENFIIIFQEKPNDFQYYFVTIHSFNFIIFNSTVVQLVLSKRKWKRKIAVEHPLTNNCNMMVDYTNKVFQLN